VAVLQAVVELQFEVPTQDSTLHEWWVLQHARFKEKDQKWFDLVCFSSVDMPCGNREMHGASRM
jgi:hypothetical protein